MNFQDELVSVPSDHIDCGFVEVGEFNGSDEYEFECYLDFKMAPDGSIWAKICDDFHELPLSPEQKAWNILNEAEEAIKAKSMAEDRAACGNWPAPKEIGDYMMWIKDEMEVQYQQLKDHPEEPERHSYAAALRGVAHELYLLGFSAIRPYWVK